MHKCTPPAHDKCAGGFFLGVQNGGNPRFFALTPYGTALKIAAIPAGISAGTNNLIKGARVANKNDLIAAVADSAGLSKADAGRAVDAVFEAITNALKTGDDVRLVGFGTFDAVKRAASEGRNPRTGEKIEIPASVQPKFRPGKGLKDALN